MTAQRYTNPTALERMSRGQCPECMCEPADHTGLGLAKCSLTDTGVAARIDQYERDQLDKLLLDQASEFGVQFPEGQ